MENLLDGPAYLAYVVITQICVNLAPSRLSGKGWAERSRFFLVLLYCSFWLAIEDGAGVGHVPLNYSSH